MKIAVIFILGLALGFAMNYLLTRQFATRNHWKKVNDYIQFERNPASYKPDATTGMLAATPPSDIRQDLAALVAAGELNHVDLVFPSVPCDRENTKQWIDFVKNYSEIVYITGNPSYTAFKVSGEQLIHLNIWFKNSSEAVIHALIAELEGNSSVRGD